MTSSPLSKSSAAAATASGATQPAPRTVLRMRRIKLNPTRAQRLVLNAFAHAARFTYNECVAAVNSGDCSANRLRLRNAFVTAKDNPFFVERAWLLDTPKVIRQQAAFEAAKNFKAAWSNKAAGNIKGFEMGFKTKRDRGYVLGLEKQLKFEGGTLAVLPETVGTIRFFEKPPIDGKPAADCSIQRDAHGDFWLLVPVYRAVKPASGTTTLAIDPGVRTPFSCYSPDARQAFFEGVEMKQRIEDVQQRVAATDRRIAAVTSGAERRKLLVHRLRLFRKYQQVRDDCHWKIAGKLTGQYGTILLPHLETSRLCGRLRAKSNRQMFGISHYLFKQRLEQKCEERGVTFVEANEAYTSKTCGACGRLHDTLGSSEVFRCPACGLRCHRDLHAARNIYLRWACSKQETAGNTLGVPVAPMAS